MKPKCVCCNFEKALINAVRSQFNEAEIAGCSFYFKQAMQRHMISKLDTDEEQVEIAMEKTAWTV